MLICIALNALAQIPSFGHDPSWISGPDNYSYSVAIGDLSGDGFLDLVFANGTIPGAANTAYISQNGSFPPTPEWVSDERRFSRGVALGDVDGDGDLDAVFGNAGGISGDFNTLYLNDGTGLMALPAWFSSLQYATSAVALADMNNDGLLDLVCANGGDTRGYNTLYLNVGGTFSPDTVWASRPSYNTNDIAIGDVNGDGYLDLVCANGIDNSRTIGQPNTLYLNHGGLLSREPDWMSEPSDSTTSVALGDVNGDGLLDLVCGNGDGFGPQYGRKNRLYLNRGESQGDVFSTKPDWESDLSRPTHSVALGDVNGDGFLDLVCGNIAMENTLYLNSAGTLSITPDWESNDARATLGVALGDINGDGNLDLICANNRQPNTIYFNESPDLTGIASWSSIQSNATRSVAIGDVNGDGQPDLVCGNSGSPGAVNTLYVAENDVFSPDTVWASNARNFTTSVALGDINGDGWLDLICGNQGLASPEPNTVYFNSQGGLARSPGWISTPLEYTLSIAVGDVNNDGRLDLVCGNGHNSVGGASNSLYYNEQATFATDTSWTSSLAHVTTSVALGDVNNDGWIDLVCGNGGFEEQVNTLYLNQHGTFSRTPAWVSGEKKNTSDIVLGDVDGDGDLDLVCGDFNVPTTLYLNEGGVFATWPAWASAIPSRTSSVLLEDMDGDGDLDLICGNNGEGNVLYKNDRGVLARDPVWISNETDYTLAVATGDIDGDGDLDIAAGNSLQPNTLHQGIRNPTFRGILSSPTGHLPNNSAFIKHVEMDRVSTNVFQIQLTAYDVESDPIWVLPEYQFEGDPTWYLAETSSPLGKVGPFPSSAAGVQSSFRWDTFMIPFDNRNVIPRLTVIEVPRRISILHRTMSYLTEIGPIPSIAARARPIAGNDFLEGREIIVELYLPRGASTEHARLHFRQGGEHTYQQTGFQEGVPLPTATISAGWTGPRGIEYWVEFQSTAGVLTDPRTQPADHPRTIRNTILNLKEPTSHPGERYRLMSVPMEPEGALSIIRMLEDDIGFPDPLRWRMFLYDATQKSYIEVPNDSLSSFEQGRGYWLVTRDGHRLDTTPVFGTSAPTDSAFVLVLERGWNLIGHPFAFSVAWDSMTVDGLSMSEAETSVVETPVTWAGDKYEYDVESFDPWTGYWVKNMTDSAVVLRIPPTESVDPVVTLEAPPYSPTARKKESSDEWFIAITTSSVCAKDLFNYVGVKTEAANHWDRHDRSEPPMGPGKSISLYFPHPAWEKHPGNYTVDIRGESRELDVDASPFFFPPDLWGQVWPFDVAKNFSAGSAGDEVVLAFAGVERVPVEWMIILVDRKLGRRIDLREQDQYVFFQGVRNILSKVEDARFVLMVGSEDFLDSHEHEIPKLPTRTVLYQNHPNPFNPSTVIRYDLAEPGQVTLRVYDVRGAFVKAIENRDRQPGRYELGWNGDDERGTKVATGVYFYKLTTKDFTQTKKMLLLK